MEAKNNPRARYSYQKRQRLLLYTIKSDNHKLFSMSITTDGVVGLRVINALLHLNRPPLTPEVHVSLKLIFLFLSFVFLLWIACDDLISGITDENSRNVIGLNQAQSSDIVAYQLFRWPRDIFIPQLFFLSEVVYASPQNTCPVVEKGWENLSQLSRNSALELTAVRIIPQNRTC